MTQGLSLFSAWFYREMGAKMPSSVFLGGIITDQSYPEFGENVSIGLDAVILGHLGHGREIILGHVSIVTEPCWICVA